MATYTSTLPDHLLHQLDEISSRMRLPKNRLIERALEIYLDQLNKAEYIKSYKKAATDDDIMNIAEEGMEEYFRQLNKEDEAG
ncbi:MAG: CopG family transcriptional regulator [Bacteroidota bacterium]